MKNIRGRFSAKKINTRQKHNFIFDIVLGILVMVFFLALKDTVWKQDMINRWFDRYIYFRMDSMTDTKKMADELVFLDFDGRSVKELGHPDITPRDKVAELVDIAYRGGAKVIFIDMDFSQPDYTPANWLAGDEAPLSGPERDNKLRTLLETIKADTASETQVILPQATFADKSMKNHIYGALADGEKIHLATPMFTISRISDQTVRFWMPYFLTEEGKLLWSVPVLGMGVYDNALPMLDDIRDEIADGNITKPYTFNIGNAYGGRRFTIYPESYRADGIIRDTTAYQYNRIQYALLPPNVSKQNPLGNIAPKNIGHWRRGGLDNKRIDCRDKIVIIGRADPDCADFFGTPAGTMPGMYVHGNSIATVLGTTQPHLTSLQKHIVIELLLIVVTALVFLFLPPFTAKIITMLLVAVCFAASYAYFCMTNEFIYFNFAFTSIGIHDVVNSLERFFSNGLPLKFLKRRGVSK